MARRDRKLSPREREVVELIAAGLTGRQVAERLGIAVGTVRALTQAARHKLGVGAGGRLVAWLTERGGWSTTTRCRAEYDSRIGCPDPGREGANACQIRGS
jgi:DNA-binding CsgD family transcriptional regulator